MKVGASAPGLYHLAGNAGGNLHWQVFVCGRQLPEQHWPSLVHCVPDGRQQTPVPPSVTEQVAASPERPGQQCEGAEHGWPRSLQQVSLLQVPVQQSPAWPLRQRPPRGAHWHVPPRQEPLQHSPSPLHHLPRGRQHVDWRQTP